MHYVLNERVYLHCLVTKVPKISEHVQAPFLIFYPPSQPLNSIQIAKPNSSPTAPTLRISDNLTRVAGVLQDMQAAGELQPMSPGIPPAVFGAGGPMYVLLPSFFFFTSGACIVHCHIASLHDYIVFDSTWHPDGS